MNAYMYKCRNACVPKIAFIAIHTQFCIFQYAPVGRKGHSSIAKEISGGASHADKAGTAAERAEVTRPGGTVCTVIC